MVPQEQEPVESCANAINEADLNDVDMIVNSSESSAVASTATDMSLDSVDEASVASVPEPVQKAAQSSAVAMESKQAQAPQQVAPEPELGELKDKEPLSVSSEPKVDVSELVAAMDRCDLDNSYQLAEFAQDIYLNRRAEESKNHPYPTYMDDQSEITSKMREKV